MADLMALRPGQTGWETEMWAEALVTYLADGTLPVPLLIPNELLTEGSSE